MPPITRHIDIYEDELLFHGQGLPLWEADPILSEDLVRTEHPEVQVGDLGYVLCGRFYRIMNVRDSNEIESILPGHEPLRLADELIRLHGHLQRNSNLSAQHTKLTKVNTGAEAAIGQGLPSIGGSFKYNSSSKTGATIFLRDDAERVLAPDSLFRKYASPRWVTWANHFSRPESAHSSRAKELVLVYGHTKTASWASLAFEHQWLQGDVEFQVDLPHIGAIDVGAHHESNTTISPRHNHGPWRPAAVTPPHSPGASARGRGNHGRGHGRRSRSRRVSTGSTSRTLKKNQTIFIDFITSAERGLRDKLHLRISLRWPSQKRMLTWERPAGSRRSTASGLITPSSKVRDTDSGTSGQNSAVDSLSDLHTEENFDIFDDEMKGGTPLDALLLYILDAAPNVDLAVASTDDLTRLFEIHREIYLREPDDVISLIEELLPPVTAEITFPLSGDGKPDSSASADDETIVGKLELGITCIKGSYHWLSSHTIVGADEGLIKPVTEINHDYSSRKAVIKQKMWTVARLSKMLAVLREESDLIAELKATSHTGHLPCYFLLQGVEEIHRTRAVSDPRHLSLRPHSPAPSIPTNRVHFVKVKIRVVAKLVRMLTVLKKEPEIVGELKGALGEHRLPVGSLHEGVEGIKRRIYDANH